MNAWQVKEWFRTGSPFIWINAGAVAISIVMVVGLLLLLAVNGLSHFWPKDVTRAVYSPEFSGSEVVAREIIGETLQVEEVTAEQLGGAGFDLIPSDSLYRRQFFKFGNRDLTGSDFGWVVTDFLTEQEKPSDIVVLERRTWGDFYGYLRSISEDGQVISSQSMSEQWRDFQFRLERVSTLQDQIEQLEREGIAQANYEVEQLRLRQRRLELQDRDAPEALLEISTARTSLEAELESFQQELNALYEAAERDSASFEAANEEFVEVSLADIVRAYQPNSMNWLQKLGLYFAKLGEFLTEEPREANTEGGVFPAIFGTVVMVLLMSVIVTPFGVIAAIYLHEYAKQGLVTRVIRIGVNNLAGVPSIVYGVFGLGFFIYIVGGEIDRRFYPEALPAPTFGTPGLLWASWTLALLTVPVVIVATEEGLARIPRSLREGSLALGATKFETLTRVVLPIASPAMMTGLILAIARAAGEVAPLMLVGVVKLAPSLPVNGIYPYIHLDQKFMHLGYHIYDVGFQSPNIDAARPLVFATALLLVLVIAALNIVAATLRNRLREKYKSLDV